MDPSTPEHVAPGRQTLKHRRGIGVVVGAVAVAALVAAVVWNRGLLKSAAVSPAPVPVATTLPVPDEVPAPATALAPSPSGHAAQQDPDADARLRTLASGLTADPAFAAWLGEPSLVQRWVAAVSRVSDGASPAPLLAFLSPKGKFEVVERGDVLVASPAAFARYDGDVKALTSIDPARAASVFAQLQAVCQATFKPIARPGARFDAALDKAIDHLLATPVTDADLALREAGGTGYAYVDPAIENLSAAQKQLLRMGPVNARAVQTWLRRFKAALPPSR